MKQSDKQLKEFTWKIEKSRKVKKKKKTIIRQKPTKIKHFSQRYLETIEERKNFAREKARQKQALMEANNDKTIIKE